MIEYLTNLGTLDLVWLVTLVVLGMVWCIRNWCLRIVCLCTGRSLNQSEIGTIVDVVWMIALVVFIIKHVGA